MAKKTTYLYGKYLPASLDFGHPNTHVSNEGNLYELDILKSDVRE